MNENELQNETGTVSKTSADMNPQSSSDVSAAGDSATSVYAADLSAAGDFPGETDTDPVKDDHVKTAPGGSARANTETDSVRPCEAQVEYVSAKGLMEKRSAAPPADKSSAGNPEKKSAAENTAGIPTATASSPLPVRDYEAEWKELAEAHPEVVGTTLPEDIFQACIKSDQAPLRVYETMMLEKMQGELARLKQENEMLRQNHDNARRAPVTGVMEGGATGMQAEDPFITAFQRYR